MVVLDPVVRILLGVVRHLGKRLIDHVEQGCSQVGGDLSGCPVGAQRVGEELLGGTDVALLGQVHVDDLAVLIHRSVHVAPHAVDLEVGLVHEPVVTRHCDGRAGRR